MVWLDLGLNPGLPGHWRTGTHKYIYIIFVYIHMCVYVLCVCVCVCMCEVLFEWSHLYIYIYIYIYVNDRLFFKRSCLRFAWRTRVSAFDSSGQVYPWKPYCMFDNCITDFSVVFAPVTLTWLLKPVVNQYTYSQN